jgi:hypothetical protein
MTALMRRAWQEGKGLVFLLLVAWLVLADGLNTVSRLGVALGQVGSGVVAGVQKLGDAAGNVDITSTGPDGETIDLSDVIIPGDLFDPSDSSSDSVLPDDAVANDSPVSTSAPAPAAQPASSNGQIASGSIAGQAPLPTAQVRVPTTSSVVVPNGLPDAARMPVPTAIPKWVDPTPLPAGDVVVNAFKSPEGTEYWCLEVKSVGKEACSGVASSFATDRAQYEIAGMIKSGLIGDPIGTHTY